MTYVRSNPLYVQALRQAFPEQADPVSFQAVSVLDRGLRGRAGDAFAVGSLSAGRYDRAYRRGETGAASVPAHGLVQARHVDATWAATASSWVRRRLAGPTAIRPRRTTTQSRDQMFFKVPTLRNVDQTGPYFHDGHVKTLEEAVRSMASTRQVLSERRDVHPDRDPPGSALTGEISTRKTSRRRRRMGEGERDRRQQQRWSSVRPARGASVIMNKGLVHSCGRDRRF